MSKSSKGKNLFEILSQQNIELHLNCRFLTHLPTMLLIKANGLKFKFSINEKSFFRVLIKQCTLKKHHLQIILFLFQFHYYRCTPIYLAIYPLKRKEFLKKEKENNHRIGQIKMSAFSFIPHFLSLNLVKNILSKQQKLHHDEENSK